MPDLLQLHSGLIVYICKCNSMASFWIPPQKQLITTATARDSCRRLASRFYDISSRHIVNPTFTGLFTRNIRESLILAAFCIVNSILYMFESRDGSNDIRKSVYSLDLSSLLNESSSEMVVIEKGMLETCALVGVSPSSLSCPFHLSLPWRRFLLPFPVLQICFVSASNFVYQ